MQLLTALALVVLVAGTTVAGGQTLKDTRGYDSLSDKGQWLLGAAREADAYYTLTKSQRATYEAIVHALEHHDLLDIVDAVTAIWGEPDTPSTQGLDQFRISVILSRDALDLLSDDGFELGDWGHVKRADGRGSNALRANGTREPGETMPKLQISWLENDPRIGEIDIDYRADGLGHLDPQNSDVRESLDAVLHYCLYQEKYGDALIDWWNAEPTQCEEIMPPPNLEGWVYLGEAGNSSNWAFDVNDVDSLQVGLRMRGTEYRQVYLRIRSGITPSTPVLFVIDSATCVELLNRSRRGGAIWVQIRRVACE